MFIIVAVFAMMCNDIALHGFGRKVSLAFRYFAFQQFDRMGCFCRRDNAAFMIFVEKVENTFGMFFVHQYFCGSFGFERY